MWCVVGCQSCSSGSLISSPGQIRKPYKATLRIVPDVSEVRWSPMNRKWWTLGAVCVATFMLLLDITVVNTALPAIQQDLGGSFTDLQWVIDAYALSLAALVLTAGSLADRLGRRRVFAIGLGDLLARLAALRAGARPDLPQPRPRPAGRRRRDHVRRLAGAGRPGVPQRPRTRDGDGHLRRDDRDRRRDRPAGRRPAHRRPRLGVGLPAQRADRPGGDRASPTGSCAESRDPNATRIDWGGLVTFSTALFLLVLALVRGNDEGWGSTADRLPVRAPRRC